MQCLNEFELEVLENLPVEPVGLSLAELADGLMGNRGPVARGKVKAALDGIAHALNGLHIGPGNDRFGGYGVQMFAIPAGKMRRVREFFASKTLYPPSPRGTPDAGA